MNKPLVYGSIYKFEGQVSVFNYTDSYANLGPTYRCLFPEPPKPGSTPNCSEIGVLGVLPGIIGTLQATEAIKIITGIGKPLSGKLLLVDALAMNFSAIEISRNNDWMNTAPQNREEFLKIDYEYFCGNKELKPLIRTVSVNEFKLMLENNADIQIIDVREPYEYPQIDDFTCIQIPLTKLIEKIHLISKDKKVVVFCKSGARSKRAIELLERDFGFTNLYNLEGGVMEWINLQSVTK